MVREMTGVQRYYQKLSKQVMWPVSARVFIESVDLAGNPREREMELAMMADFERKDWYEATRMRTNVPNPALLTRDSRAGHWLEVWRVLPVSEKSCGAAASAALAAGRSRHRLGAAAGDSSTATAGDSAAGGGGAGGGAASSAVLSAAAASEGGAAADSDGTASQDADDDGTSLASGKRRRPSSFADRPLCTTATLARNAARSRDLAIDNESTANTEALQILGGATAPGNLVATLSAPANREIPRYRDFSARRADALFAEHMAGIAGAAAGTGGDGSFALAGAAGAAGEAARNWRDADPTAATAAAAATPGTAPIGAPPGAAAAASMEPTRNCRRAALAAAAAGGGGPDGLPPGAEAAAADVPATNGRRAPALTARRGGLGAAGGADGDGGDYGGAADESTYGTEEEAPRVAAAATGNATPRHRRVVHRPLKG